MSPPGRRRFLRSLAGAGASGVLVPPMRALASGPAVAPKLKARPVITHGVSSGDLWNDRAVVWSRADRSAQMTVEWSTTESFKNPRKVPGSIASIESGFTGKADLAELPAGETVFYRVRFETEDGAASEPIVGRLRVPSKEPSDLLVTWSADTAGQGWGINREWGGMRLYETMRRTNPDLFLHCGDTVYADQPIKKEVTLDDGTLWTNVVTEAKSAPAESLDQFRGNHLYNLGDENVRRFNAEVAQVAIWDDHEVRDNWNPVQLLSDERYTEKRVAMLSARARQALIEHFPIRTTRVDPRRIYRSYPFGPLAEIFSLDLRSYRSPDTHNRQPAADGATRLFGPAQMNWFKARLKATAATWKIIQCGVPLGVVVPDGKDGQEGVANADPALLGREFEIASLLRFIKTENIRNVVWVTGDVHYAAAHHYHPDRATFKEFAPFWEFVAGPMNAGTFGPNPLDTTFGPEAKFVGVPADMKPNRPPSAGFQFFGGLRLDGKTRTLTATLHNVAGDVIYTQPIEPAG